MKQLFIEAEYTGRVKIDAKEIAKLPDRIGIVTTVQFVRQIGDIKKQIVGKNIFVGKGKQDYECQILGCDVSAAESISKKVDAFLYIGDGSFHAIAIGMLGKPVYILNPFESSIKLLDEKVIEDYKKRKKAALLKFLNAKNVGILISTKKGQYYNPKNLLFLEKKYKEKKFYYFVCDTIDLKQIDNFRFVEAWINAACPRLEEDALLLNIKDIE
jgi:2-(3-amino-3-carboxypropyl)histidine synthase